MGLQCSFSSTASARLAFFAGKNAQYGLSKDPILTQNDDVIIFPTSLKNPLYNQIERILGKKDFWAIQGHMSLGAPERIKSMQGVIQSNLDTKLTHLANYALAATQQKKWYQKCCSSFFAKPVMRTDATQEFYKAVAKAATHPEEAMAALDRWELKYKPDAVVKMSKESVKYVGLGGRF